MVNLKLTGSPERHCRLHSTTLTLAPLNKVHPAAFPVSVTQERRTVMLQLRLIGISLSHFSNHTWHVPVRWEALSWWDEEAPGRQRAAQTLYLLPARRRRRRLEGKKEQLRNSYKKLAASVFEGTASVSASLFFMSNLVSSVTPHEECESVQFSHFKVKPQLLRTKT